MKLWVWGHKTFGDAVELEVERLTSTPTRPHATLEAAYEGWTRKPGTFGPDDPGQAFTSNSEEALRHLLGTHHAVFDRQSEQGPYGIPQSAVFIPSEVEEQLRYARKRIDDFYGPTNIFPFVQAFGGAMDGYLKDVAEPLNQFGDNLRSLFGLPVMHVPEVPVPYTPTRKDRILTRIAVIRLAVAKFAFRIISGSHFEEYT